MDRRSFLTAAATLAAAPSLLAQPLRLPSGTLSTKRPFQFGFLSDTRLGTPDSLRWTETALATIRHRYPKVRLLIHGGDLLARGESHSSEDSDGLVAKWQDLVGRYGFEARHVMGDHDLAALATPADGGHGKDFFAREVGPLNSHIQFGPLDLLFLDSIRMKDGSWEASIDPFGLTWLSDRLAAIPTGTPIVLVTHVPIRSIVPQYEMDASVAPPGPMRIQNAEEVASMLEPHRVVAALQGHTHVVAEHDDRRTLWITGGSVCGDDWKGPAFGRYEPSFGICTWDGDRLTYASETYGWKPG